MNHPAHRIVHYLILAYFLAIPNFVSGQHYASDDTTHTYKAHGTIYANGFVGRKTSSGEIFHHSGYTAAHWKIKLGTYVLVTNANNGLQVVVQINDRCPNKGVIDLTRTAANAIGIQGCQHVTVRILPDRYAYYWRLQDDLSVKKPSWLPAQARPLFKNKK